MIRAVPVLTALLLSYPAQALITFLGADGASNIDNLFRPQTTIIYGGTAGAEESCDHNNGVTTCNNCSGKIMSCNTQRIYSNLDLVIRFSSSTTTGFPVLVLDGTVVAKGEAALATQTATIRLRWSDLCQAIGSDYYCREDMTRLFELGIDNDNDASTLEDYDYVMITVTSPVADSEFDQTDHCEGKRPSNGICDFTAQPGKQKVRIKEFNWSGTFPIHKGKYFERIRVFYSTKGFYHVTNRSNYVDLEFEYKDDRVWLKDSAVGPLEKQLPHFFRLGLVDSAGNVSHLTSDTMIDNSGGQCRSSWVAKDVSQEPIKDLLCDLIATPGI